MMNFYCVLFIFFQFSEDGKDYLSILKATGDWIESQLVLCLLATDQEDGISKQSNVSQLIIQVRGLLLDWKQLDL